MSRSEAERRQTRIQEIGIILDGLASSDLLPMLPETADKMTEEFLRVGFEKIGISFINLDENGRFAEEMAKVNALPKDGVTLFTPSSWTPLRRNSFALNRLGESLYQGREPRSTRSEQVKKYHLLRSQFVDKWLSETVGRLKEKRPNSPFVLGIERAVSFTVE